MVKYYAIVASCASDLEPKLEDLRREKEDPHNEITSINIDTKIFYVSFLLFPFTKFKFY